jgi:enoyl-CoA hydratase/carnithine racemase
MIMTTSKPSSNEEREVLYEVQDHIATIMVNRPDYQNTISGPMLNAVTQYLKDANRDPEVRVIVLKGKGRFFCAGLDVRAQQEGRGIGSGGGAPSTTIDLSRTPPTVLHSVDKPTICALGSAAGYGMDLALGCDMRVMAESAKLSAAFAKRGLLPESGGTWLLPKIVGWSKAAELIFTGRTLTAAECLELGLVSQVVPDGQLETAANNLAQEIAVNAPLAVQAAKRMMRMGLNEPFPEHVHHVFLQLLPLMQTEDIKEGMLAFLEKREPKFQGK